MQSTGHASTHTPRVSSRYSNNVGHTAPLLRLLLLHLQMCSGVVSLELRLLPNFDVITLVGVGNDQEWVVYFFLTPQLFYSEGGHGQQIGDFPGFGLNKFGDITHLF